MNIAEVLSKKALQMGDAVAIRDTFRGEERSITFSELHRRSSQAAALFLSRGLKPGDSVLVLHGMSIELYVTLVGIFSAGMVAMFLDPSAGPSHVRRCCDLQAPKALVGSPKTLCLCITSSALRHICNRFVIGPWFPGAVCLSQSDRHDPIHAICPVVAEAPALLTFTSGTTGRPKATVRSHSFLQAQHRVLERSLALTAGEVDLTTLPIFLLANLGSGVTSIIPNADLRRPGCIVPEPVLAQIKRFNPSRTAGSPALYECLLRHLEQRPKNGNEIKPLKVYTGGAPVFPLLLSRLKTNFKQEPEAIYGSTEAEPMAHLGYTEMTPDDLSAMRAGQGLLAGHPVAEIRLRILRDQWGVPLGAISQDDLNLLTTSMNEPGEIVVSGEHVLTTYLHGKGNEDTKFIVEGVTWHRTGDLGYMDKADRLWLLGRCVAKIVDNRGTLFPFAVECAAHHFEWVQLAGCVSSKGKRWLALQVRRNPSDLDMQELKETLHWAQLDGFKLVPQLPVDKRHNAKIDYARLRQILEP